MKKNQDFPRSAVCCLLLAVCSLLRAGVADRIVAVVADQPILESQVLTGVEFLKLQMPGAESLPAPTESTLRSQVLEQLISDQVILEQARVETVSVTKAQVDEELDATLRRLRERFGGPESLAQALAREGLTESQLRQRYRDEINQRLTAQQLLARHDLIENILVSPIEVREFYAAHRDSFGTVPGRVKLAHILLIPKPADAVEQKAYEQIAQAYAGLKNSGWDFEAIATSFSTSVDVKRRAGLLRSTERGELPEEVEAVLYNLPTGEFSQPFRTRQGWMIIKRERSAGSTVVAREILIEVPVTAGDSVRTRQLADALRQRAQAGENFAALAKEYSDDPGTRAEGGMLGEFFIRGLVPPFSLVVESLAAGEVSRPIPAEHGFHIIKVLERVDEKTPTYEELQDDIRNYLYSQKLKEKLDAFVREHAARISIQRF